LVGYFYDLFIDMNYVGAVAADLVPIGNMLDGVSDIGIVFRLVLAF